MEITITHLEADTDVRCPFCGGRYKAMATQNGNIRFAHVYCDECNATAPIIKGDRPFGESLEELMVATICNAACMLEVNKHEDSTATEAGGSGH